MHERKAIMAEKSDAFLALPGGLGTLEEIFEVWTWRQLGFHRKPVGFLNADGFWTPLLKALDTIAADGFLAQGTRMTVLPGLRVLVLNASRISARGRTWPITGSARTSWQSQHARWAECAGTSGRRTIRPARACSVVSLSAGLGLLRWAGLGGEGGVVGNAEQAAFDAVADGVADVLGRGQQPVGELLRCRGDGAARAPHR